ncbi:helix-turn-helix domain-containing protein [Amycolatopsis sp. NPDC004079]|uniref:helix-turn-helix domain-containing protein n=1 Tax=Amycolatopsis sp. NPDC004079 TaxID=3154549 RepID=UPI0033A4F409
MEQPGIAARRVGPALVLSLSLGDAPTADVIHRLLAVSAENAPSALIALDLRGVDVLTVRTARAVIAFARASIERGVRCALVSRSLGGAAKAVLDAADPDAAVPRFATVERALADSGAGPRPKAVVTCLELDSTDLGRTEEFLSASHAPLRIGSTSGRSSARITHLVADAVSVGRIELAFETTYDAGPLGRICLCAVDSGETEHRVAGWREPEKFGSGELFCVAPPDRPFAGRAAQGRYTVTTLDPALLGHLAGARQPVRLLAHRPHNAGAARHLRTAIAHLRDEVLSAPAVSGNLLAVSAASNYLAASVLNAFPNTTSAEHEGSARSDAHPRTLRRAIAFMETHADRDIDPADIAWAARVSVRAVQLAFRRHLGTTPMAYLRRIRLDHARTELWTAVSGKTTVTQVAARWGYARPSMFAAHYRAAYGESPSQTLRGD